MENKVIGIGVIGCGNICDTYMKNFTEHYDNVKVMAMADMFVEKAVEKAEKYGVPKGCPVEELLADDDVQIVVNLTIPAAHYSVNKQILEAGKHCYCEKPLALSIADAKELADLAASKGLMVASAPDTFMGGAIQSCIKMVDDGMIGKPVGFTANMMSPGTDLWHPNPDFFFKKGAGPMLDMGPYYITALITLFGPIKRVSCFCTRGRDVRKNLDKEIVCEVPTHYAGIMEFENGVVGNINMSFDTWDTELPLMEIFGTLGRISVPDPNLFNGKIKYYDAAGIIDLVNSVTDPFPAKIITMVTKTPEFRKELDPSYPTDPDPHCNMRGLGVSDMAQSIIDGRKPILTAQTAQHVVEALLAFEISSETGKAYEMTTKCERPARMPEGLPLWGVETK